MTEQAWDPLTVSRGDASLEQLGIKKDLGPSGSFHPFCGGIQFHFGIKTDGTIVEYCPRCGRTNNHMGGCPNCDDPNPQNDGVCHSIDPAGWTMRCRRPTVSQDERERRAKESREERVREYDLWLHEQFASRTISEVKRIGWTGLRFFFTDGNNLTVCVSSDFLGTPLVIEGGMKKMLPVF